MPIGDYNLNYDPYGTFATSGSATTVATFNDFEEGGVTVNFNYSNFHVNFTPNQTTAASGNNVLWGQGCGQWVEMGQIQEMYVSPDYQFLGVCAGSNIAPETEEQKAKRATAEQRAEELLMLVLNEEQRQQYLELGYFETAVDDRVYRVRKGYSGNVFKVEDGKEKFRYCIHPSSCDSGGRYRYIPDADTMAAQLLMLRNDEQKFLQTANRTELYG